MRCDEFDPEKYVEALIGEVIGEEVKPSALEHYLHCETCPTDRKKFEEFILKNYKPNQDEYGLIYEGLRIVGETVGDE